jgi:uncharacterized protein (DUF362 family)
MQGTHTRREWLKNTASLLSGISPVGLARQSKTAAPAAPVAVTGCRTYGPELLPAMENLFDRLGGLGRLVKGKTVAIKINLTGSPTLRLGYWPLGDSHYTNSQVIAAAVHLIGKAGARRIRLLESPWATADPLEEVLLQADWEPRDFQNAAANVEFENTNYLGRARKYSRLKVPFGGYIFPAYDLNHSYEDCDVFVSLAKLKEHGTAGITFSMKNCFGITPATIYGQGAGIDEPSELPKGGRTIFHRGDRQPSKSSPGEIDPQSSRSDGYRVPRVVVDLVAARPIDLAIVEGVKTMTGGEGPWISGNLSVVNPGVLIAGTNPVTTDAVCTAIMGFDPMADRGILPFKSCDNTLRLAEDAGIGTRDLQRIEVIGLPIQKARFDFSAFHKKKPE